MMRVRLASPLARVEPLAPSLFAGTRPFATVGFAPPFGADATPLSPAADTLFAPRGAALLSPRGPLWVADTGHHRLLGWSALPAGERAPADRLLGQASFTS